MLAARSVPREVEKELAQSGRSPYRAGRKAHRPAKRLIEKPERDGGRDRDALIWWGALTIVGCLISVGYGRGLGLHPGGGLSLILIIVIVLALTGHI